MINPKRFVAAFAVFVLSFVVLAATLFADDEGCGEKDKVRVTVTSSYTIAGRYDVRTDGSYDFRDLRVVRDEFVNEDHPEKNWTATQLYLAFGSANKGAGGFSRSTHVNVYGVPADSLVISGDGREAKVDLDLGTLDPRTISVLLCETECVQGDLSAVPDTVVKFSWRLTSALRSGPFQGTFREDASRSTFTSRGSILQGGAVGSGVFAGKTLSSERPDFWISRRVTHGVSPAGATYTPDPIFFPGSGSGVIGKGLAPPGSVPEGVFRVPPPQPLF